jgi:RNA polymerase sigma factor (sigma-70 family)
VENPTDAALAEAFDLQRGRLVAAAYRMLGSRADAEDAVQEAWLRLARQDAGAVENVPAWLTTVVARICLDALRAREARPEAPYAELPDIVVTEDDGATPESDLLHAESVGLAMLVVLDSLAPAERVAFVLHDAFAIPYRDIAPVLGRTVDATKMLASRARRKVRRTRPSDHGRSEQRAVVDAFLAAARSGSFEDLVRVLDPDVTLYTHAARGLRARSGASQVAKTFQRGRGRVTARRVLVNGEPGIIAWGSRGKPLSVMACTVARGRIVEIHSVTDAARLASMDLPERDG